MPEADENQHCPTPGAHDKLNEAHYFIHEMANHYHEPDLFRYSLSAFVQAARNITFVLQAEMSGKAGFDKLWTNFQGVMRADPDLKLLNDVRITVVHRSSLVPSSSMFIGHFKYGKPKAGFASMPLNPMTESIEALVRGRQADDFFVHPHRVWCGEEFGLQRKWALKEAPDRELVQFALSSLGKIAEIFSKVHEWAGFHAFKHGNCEHFDSEDYRALRESEVFPEVAKAWDGPPTEQVSPVKSALLLLRAPSDSSDALHEVPVGKTAKGWINMEFSKFWDREFTSMLLYSIGEDVITKNTGVFFRRSSASVTKIPQDNNVDESAEIK